MPEEANKAKAIRNRVRLTLFFLLVPLQILFVTGLFSSLCFAALPKLGTITPSSGTTTPNTAKTFTCKYSDKDGWANLKEAYLLISASSTNLTNSAYLYYDQNTNLLYLRNDANTTWLGGFSPRSANTIENSQVKLNCALTTASGSGSTLTVKFNISFKPAYSGKTYKTYLKVTDDTNGSAGWTQKGTITIKTTGDTTPPQGSISINNTANYTNSAAVTLSLSAQDNTGGSGLAQMQFSNNNTNWSAPEGYATSKAWTLTSGDGAKTVSVKYKDVAGNWSGSVSDTIVLDATKPTLNITFPQDGAIITDP